MQETDVLIIGAGPSGSVAAAYLNQHGFKVTIIEKMKFPRFVIGESLLPRCMDLLTEANLLDAVKSANFQKKFGAKFIQGKKVCDFNFEDQYTPGWTWTWQVPREDFDHILAKAVESRGVQVKYETSVDAVSFENDHVITRISSSDGVSEIKSRYVIDSSGYGRVLPKLLDLDSPSDFPPRAAFFTHIKDVHRPDNIDGNRIQVVVLKQEVWVWIIPFSNGNTSFGVVGDLSFLDDAKTDEENLRNLIDSNSFLKERIGHAEFVFEPRKISGYSASVKKFFGDKFVLTGNSTEFLDPVFSSGVTLALESGLLAAKLIARQLKGDTVDWDQEYVAYIKRGVDTFRSYVSGWYDGTLQTIFFADEINSDIKKRICSVLAGYVWDETNPYVKKHKTSLQTLARVIDIENRKTLS
jgi:flavin-dependent dehydrogenase